MPDIDTKAENKSSGKTALVSWLTIIGLIASTITGVVKCTDSGREYWNKMTGQPAEAGVTGNPASGPPAHPSGAFWLDGHWLGKIQDSYSTAEDPYQMELQSNWPAKDLLTRYESLHCDGKLEVLTYSEGMVECVEHISQKECEDRSEIKIERLTDDLIEISFYKPQQFGHRPIAKGKLSRQQH